MSLTVGTTEGPYYISNTAELKNGELNYTGLPGERVGISGHVYGGAGDSGPLAGAKIEIWHSDSSGHYHPSANGDASRFQAGKLALRGHVLTDANGHYRFSSIYPGIYWGRCRHFHVKVSAAAYGAVTTQLIVPARPGDAMTPEEDSIAHSLPAVNLLEFVSKDGVLASSFDFHLGGD